MRQLFKNVRFYVLLFSFGLSLGIYYWVITFIPPGSLPTIRLTQLYAWTALTYLYVSLLIGPLVFVWRTMPWRGTVFKARRAVGVSAFYFACLHAYLAFFKQLGGFSGLGFLTSRYLTAIILSFTALIILALMAATSFDKAVVRLKFWRWKLLHRCVYLAGVLILIHAVLIGTHFQDLLHPLPQLLLTAVLGLLVLQARRFDAYLHRRWPGRFRPGLTSGLLLVVTLGLIIYFVGFYSPGHH